jgi:hypothetical protein
MTGSYGRDYDTVGAVATAAIGGAAAETTERRGSIPSRSPKDGNVLKAIKRSWHGWADEGAGEARTVS